ncbi:hypothetical protein ZWY2020_051012 [Hordeum vulgare]|nr:hypothetical protein ZWY2020_051012 [Hordeum vulgare]
MISPQPAKRLRYASCQQFLGPASLFRAFSSSFSPRGLLVPSIEKSATAPSSSIIGARSPAAEDDRDEKMFHDSPLLRRGHSHKQAKINSTNDAFFLMALVEPEKQ